MRVLVTRPEPEASATADRLRAMGHDPIVDPLLVPRPLDAALPDPAGIQAVALTSRAAARLLGQHPEIGAYRDKPVFTVGDATAAAAREAGFADVRSAGGTWEDLARRLLAACDPAGGAVLYAAGVDRSGDLAGRLAPDGLTVVTSEIYRMDPSDHLDPATVTALADGSIRAVLLYSKRTADLFVSRLTEAFEGRNWPAPTVHAISAPVAARVAEAGFQRVVVADEPTAESLLATLR